MTISEIFSNMDWGLAPENDEHAKSWLKENKMSLDILLMVNLPMQKIILKLKILRIINF